MRKDDIVRHSSTGKEAKVLFYNPYNNLVRIKYIGDDDFPCWVRADLLEVIKPRSIKAIKCECGLRDLDVPISAHFRYCPIFKEIK